MTARLFVPAATARAAKSDASRRILRFLRDLAALWWWGMRRHVAELNGFPREAVEAPPQLRWPFAHL